MIQSPNAGGVFQYTNKGRNYENNYLNKNYIGNIINGKIENQKIKCKTWNFIIILWKKLST